LVRELILTDDVTEGLTAVVRRLIAISPRGWKCLFLNCEIRDTESDNAISPDLFVVLKPWFGKVKCKRLDIDWETADLLLALGQRVLAQANSQQVIIDIVIKGNGQYKAYRDDGPLRRLGGGDGMYRTKYRDYLSVDRWLAELDKAAR
jgi:hypothetical protein